MRKSWLIGGWLAAMLASAIPALRMVADVAARNPLGQYVDEASGAYKPLVYEMFLRWWLPVAIPVALLGLAAMVMNRPPD